MNILQKGSKGLMLGLMLSTEHKGSALEIRRASEVGIAEPARKGNKTLSVEIPAVGSSPCAATSVI